MSNLESLMMTPQNIEAELSYAYVHAVVSRLGVGCQVANRILDDAGIDATLHVKHDFGSGAILTDFSVHLQLKAISKSPKAKDNRLPYFFEGIEKYNRLRAESVMPPHLLVVLFLPSDRKDWLTCTNEQLILRRRAYWLSLRGAQESHNRTGQTVYIPESQYFSPENLKEILHKIAKQEELRYEQ